MKSIINKCVLDSKDLQILKYRSQGMSISAIAVQMGNVEQTIRNRMCGIYYKLNVKNVIQAIKVAEDNGWLG